jgi:hypothetical protein
MQDQSPYTTVPFLTFIGGFMTEAWYVIGLDPLAQYDWPPGSSSGERGPLPLCNGCGQGDGDGGGIMAPLSLGHGYENSVHHIKKGITIPNDEAGCFGGLGGGGFQDYKSAWAFAHDKTEEFNARYQTIFITKVITKL